MLYWIQMYYLKGYIQLVSTFKKFFWEDQMLTYWILNISKNVFKILFDFHSFSLLMHFRTLRTQKNYIDLSFVSIIKMFIRDSFTLCKYKKEKYRLMQIFFLIEILNDYTVECSRHLKNWIFLNFFCCIWLKSADSCCIGIDKLILLYIIWNVIHIDFVKTLKAFCIINC